jgi:preprotein translocase subunit SecA
MRQGIFLRSYAQKNPKQEYKREAFELFSAMLDHIKYDTITTVSKIQIRSQAEIEREELERQQRLARALQFQHEEAVSPILMAAPGESPQPEIVNAPVGRDARLGRDAPVGRAENAPGTSDSAPPYVRDFPKVGRNETCPCGSGRKYKHCHGALQQPVVERSAEDR